MTTSPSTHSRGFVIGGLLLAVGIIGGIIAVVSGAVALVNAANARQHVPISTNGWRQELTHTGKLDLWYEADDAFGAHDVPDIDAEILTPSGRRILVALFDRRGSGSFSESTSNGRSSTLVGSFEADQAGTYQFTFSGPGIDNVSPDTRLGVGPPTPGGAVAAIVAGLL
ncbi:MAG TPA: hypothetical protein VGM93_03290, partial [Acidimicrobiales bacterium]